MEWLDWNDEVFARARRARRPVLLFVKAAWCRWCKELEQRALADPRVIEKLEQSFVAISVDKDRRPDIDPRYTMGGWPTLAWLDDSGEILGADNYLETDDLIERLETVARLYGEGSDAVRDYLLQDGRAKKPVPTPPQSKAALGTQTVALSLEIVESVGKSVVETADALHGGWGKQHKFPHPEAIDFALIRWTQTGEPAMLDLVRSTLRKMQAGEIHDTVEGGFFRYATRADWSVPHHEKMLDSNAQRIFAYLEAYQALGDEKFCRTAEHGLEWMMSTLFDPETKAFKGSQDADADYAHLGTIEARRQRGAPPCDPTVFTNWNAMAVSTLLKAGAVLDDRAWIEHGLDTLRFLLAELWDENLGMYHYWDGGRHLPGMLSDQAYTLRALVDAVQFAGANHHLDAAERLASLAIESLKSEAGGFYDKAHDPYARGGLRRRNRSILDNSVMAEALLRLSLLTGESDYEDCAKEALASFAGDYRRYGHFVAGYARAVDLFFHRPVVVTVVGPREAPLTRSLMQAALGPYVASRIVRNFDPQHDVELLERSGLPVPAENARAYVERGRESYAETSDPTKLPALMMRT